MNTTPAENRPLNILLVEDNPADAELTRFSLDEIGGGHSMQLAEDGEEAMAILLKEGNYKNSATPDIILLDLNLPKLSGKEVLLKIKNNEVLSDIPIVILTSSAAKIDIKDSYRLEATCYITKPIDSEKLKSALCLDCSSEWFIN